MAICSVNSFNYSLTWVGVETVTEYAEMFGKDSNGFPSGELSFDVFEGAGQKTVLEMIQ